MPGVIGSRVSKEQRDLRKYDPTVVCLPRGSCAAVARYLLHFRYETVWFALVLARGEN
jgi:hypothetical protein